MRKKLKNMLSREELSIAKLDAMLQLLGDSDRAFAANLLRQYKTKGRLSGRQWYWVREMVNAV